MASDAELGRGMARLSTAECLARAVLMFYDAAPWDQEKQKVWKALTGREEATTKVLCDLARRVRTMEERQ